MKPLLVALFLAALGSLGCSGDCRLGDPVACDPGLVCAPVGTGTSTGCFPPVEVRGRVVDLASQQGLSGVLVHALDETGVPAGELTSTGADGAFTLQIPIVRQDEGGAPRTTRVTLLAQAQGYQDFPGVLRVPPAIDTATATQAHADQPWVVEAPAATVGLVQLPTERQGWPHISGTLQFAADQGAPLVVAEANGQGVAFTLADDFGQFLLPNLPPGTYSLRIYSQNATYAKADGIAVAAGSSVDGVLIAQVDPVVATVSGTVQLPPGTGPTSVVLVPKSTLLPGLERGQVPPGLRAPLPGVTPDVTGAFSISGVPDGDYYLIPASEGDGLVRDPHPTFAGSDLLEVLVTGGSVSPAAPPPLAVVQAVQLLSPGATETPDAVGTTPTLTWAAYPGAASYAVTVFDGLGAPVFQATPAGSETQISVTPALAPGAIYQWRITALDGAGAPLSQSEETLGTFQVQ